MADERARPFKVWNCSRSAKKSVVARSLAELKEKGTSKLDITGDVRLTVVLESDGTEVDDEEYFSFLEDNTCFLLLQGSEIWSERPNHNDEVDHNGIECDDGMDDEDGGQVKRVTQKVKGNISNIITLGQDELQDLVDGDTRTIASELKLSIGGAKDIQSLCQKHLDNQQRATEALEFIELLKEAGNEESRRKMPKTDSS